MLHVTGIPAFQDNYLWLIHDAQNAVVVDPGDARPIMEYLRKQGLTLTGILITHHHADHIGGVADLTAHFSVPVYGPKDSRLPMVTHELSDNAAVDLHELNLRLHVIHVPGHTATHVAYFTEHDELGPSLFCGDTLFAGGCGRLFEGSSEQMHHSLTSLAELPALTNIFCAHEYTLANLRFALKLEPNNQALQQRFETVKTQRDNGIATVPSQLHTELETNPFLRVNTPEIAASAATYAQRKLNNAVDVFAVIREWKNNA